MARWEDLTARIRGLSTHLLDRGRLDELARAADVSDLVRRLEPASIQPDEGEGTLPERLERSFRRRAAQHLAILGRWAGRRLTALRVIYEDEDRRSIRALLRGLTSGAAPSSRLAGLIPTPDLPLRALEQLARLDHPAKLAALLMTWGNVYGATLQKHAGGTEPDLLEAELALARAWAARIREGAKKGDRPLREFVAETLDYENALTAMGLAGQSLPPDLEHWFLEGGRLASSALGEAATAPSPVQAADRLIRQLPPSALAQSLRLQRGSLPALEWTFLSLRITALHRQVRLEPVGSATILWFALRVRRELLTLQRILWTTSLQAPSEDRLAAVEASWDTTCA